LCYVASEILIVGVTPQGQFGFFIAILTPLAFME